MSLNSELARTKILAAIIAKLQDYNGIRPTAVTPVTAQ